MRASRATSSSSRKLNRTPRVGLAPHEERKLKSKLRRRSPSEPWVEAQIKSSADVTADGLPIVYRYHDPHAFPPGGRQTAMIRCPKCGIFNPPNTFEGGACLDHARHDAWGPSPSAVAIEKFIALNLHPEVELEPEDVHSLQHEIRQYLKSQTCAPKS
jgi:hypothetical protein